MSEIYNFGVFLVERKRVALTDGESRWHSVLRCPDWVNVIAFTSDERLVLVRQFRLGSNEHTVELPGGIVDKKSDPLFCAKDELLEEAGLSSSDWFHLGRFRPNAALQDNWCHTYLCTGAMLSKSDPEQGCQVILVDATTYITTYQHRLLHQALMATAIMLAHKAVLPADARRLCDLFFIA